MKYSDLVVELKKLGLPSVYHHWEIDKVPTLPYLIHMKTGRDDVAGDNINYFRNQGVAIELYSRTPDFKNEELIEATLTKLGFFFTTDESTFVENMYLKRYEFTLKGENYGK